MLFVYDLCFGKIHFACKRIFVLFWGERGGGGYNTFF